MSKRGIESLRALAAILSTRRFLPICFAGFVLIRLAVLLILPITPTSDSAWYVDRAMEIANGEGYHEGSWPTAFWPIGYPAFLAGVFVLFGKHLLAAKLVNLALSCGIFRLTYRLGRALFGNELAARIAVLLLTIYPNQIAYTGALWSEMLVTVLLLLGLHRYIRRRSLAAALVTGVVFGCAALVKSQMLVIPAILGMASLASAASIGAAIKTGLQNAVCVIGMLAVILPWSARNYGTFHHFVLISTNGGITFVSGNNPEARGDFTPESPLVAATHFTVADQVAANQRAYTLGYAWIEAHPLAAARLLPLKVWRLWAPDGEGEWWFQRGYAGYDRNATAFRIARGANQAFYALVLLAWIASLPSLVRAASRDRAWLTLPLVMVLYLTMISMVYSGQSRFHFPVMPLIFTQVGWWLSQLVSARQAVAEAARNNAAAASIPALQRP
nr:glycosyltransferase family 39 protein [uncultured Rhodopila sp.]